MYVYIVEKNDDHDLVVYIGIFRGPDLELLQFFLEILCDQ